LPSSSTSFPIVNLADVIVIAVFISSFAAIDLADVADVVFAFVISVVVVVVVVVVLKSTPESKITN